MLLSKTVTLFPFSVGACIKHLPHTPKPPFHIIKFIKNTTTFALKASHFQTLTPNQKHQVHLYINSLNQWNQVQ
ncbi:hypothetical protein LIER_33553 [Lithospermum erythrorhizon]|uniref:Uncharacterized protein n=1 Tax=Lithospermum erythrorhizon TaxID=34254 RepID=A0AAV3RZJ4_LITER